jgi:hypothetical protein
VSAHGKTPWEAFYSEKLDVSHMRVFGAWAFMHVPGALRHKLEPVSEKGWFIGYKADARAYRILRERDGRVIISRDVIVDKRVGSKPESEFGIDPVEALEKEPRNGEPVRAIQTPPKEAHKEMEPEESGESEKGAERRYPT